MTSDQFFLLRRINITIVNVETMEIRAINGVKNRGGGARWK